MTKQERESLGGSGLGFIGRGEAAGDRGCATTANGASGVAIKTAHGDGFGWDETAAATSPGGRGNTAGG